MPDSHFAVPRPAQCLEGQGHVIVRQAGPDLSRRADTGADPGTIGFPQFQIL
jgi:hypothetical protein